MSVAEGFAAIGQAWDVVTEQAAKAGQPEPDRSSWRILGNMHLAETREQAIEDCTYGLQQFRSEEHTSELQSLMRISYAVFCLKKKIQTIQVPQIKYNTTTQQRSKHTRSHNTTH